MSAAKAKTPKDGSGDLRRRALEWKRFRATFLYSQLHLAQALGCSRRTVCAIENAESTPQYSLLRRFRTLKRQQEREEGEAA